MSTMSLVDLLGTYADGDEHGWSTEFAFLHADHTQRIAELRSAVERHGITEPITLGYDMRVWDGHHRLCVANDLGLDQVPVAFVSPWSDDS